ncbi:hypothetical protein ASZ90_018150 [hydrocarbon metagenome]|uniref:Outer membrane protein n=1 Tax=hydrocarbon metagenome TaxID=938273 RepID=A0A0W8E6Y1_9ZZZZ
MNLSINKSKNKVHYLILISVLMISLLFMTTSPVLAEDNPAPNVPVVVVSAIGTVNVVPDQALISMAILKTDPNLNRALESNNSTTENVIAAMKNAGISEVDIKTSNFSVYPEYDYSETGQNKIKSYQVRNEISVLVRDLNKVGSILDTAISSGANTLNYVNFKKADTSAAENQALVQAVKRAREKAGILSTAAGLTVGRLVSITEGYGQPVFYSNTVYAEDIKGMGGASVPINPGELQINASVTIVYEMN